ncbi:hypothetical protein AMTRI_Chr04g252110 [Amborella trichopoda]
MESQGFKGSKMTALLLSRPKLLDQEPSRLKQLTEKVKKLGIDPGSKMYPHVVAIMSSMSNKTWQRKIELFKTFGWSKEDEKLQKTMAYWVKELKFDKNFLVLRPHLFVHSLEGSVIPRNSLLTVNLSTVCYLSEKAFLERYVFSFGGESENLLRIYKESKEKPRIYDEFMPLHQAS